MQGIVQIILPLLLSGLLSTVIVLYFQKRQSIREHNALLLSFATELVLAFERCAFYCEQESKNEISYSELYDFTDASMLSKLTGATNNHEIIYAIIDLKSRYFQIGRHVREAATLAAQAERVADVHAEKVQLMPGARHAQGTALAFFRSYREDIERGTQEVLEATKEIAPKNVAAALEGRFLKAKDLIKDLMENIRRQ